MKGQKKEFIEGAVNNSIKQRTAESIYDLIEKFAKYGFNKSHSTAYAYVAYQTAYLKTHYPAEFMAANMTSEMNSTSRVVTLINECRKLKLTVHPPDVNESHIVFKPLDGKTISFGLNAIKNVGTKALKNILLARKEHGPFKTLFDFCAPLDLRLVNRKVLESLVAAGAMDSLEGTRGQKFRAVEIALKYAQQVQIQMTDDQCSLFDLEGSGLSSVQIMPSLPDVPDWSETEKLRREKELMGFYLTGHPLLKYADDLERFSNFDFTEHNDYDHGQVLKLGGIIQEIKHHFDKKNQQMVFFSLDCLGGRVDVLVFHDTFKKHRDLIEEEQLIFVKGRSTTRMGNDTPKIIAEDILSLEELQQRNTDSVNVLIEVEKMKVDDVDALYNLAQKHSGNSPLFFHIHDEEGHNHRMLAKRIKVASNNTFLAKLKDLYGKDNVWTN